MNDEDDSLELAHRTPKGVYTGEELRTHAGRPGAMQAFDLPSRFGDKLRYRDGSIRDVKESN